MNPFAEYIFKWLDLNRECHTETLETKGGMMFYFGIIIYFDEVNINGKDILLYRDCCGEGPQHADIPFDIFEAMLRMDKINNVC